MKKSNLKYAVIAAAASALLIFSGCGEAAEAPAGASPAAAAAQEERAGALLLSVNPAIEMEYDTAGDVLTLTGLNDDARSVLTGYDSYYGRPVSDVAAELVGEIDEGRILRRRDSRARAQHCAQARARQRAPGGLPHRG